MGIVFDIQKCSYHDGPGIRTTVFLKGCQLRCAWCHNPESFAMKPQLKYQSDKCINCRLCEEICTNKVHSFPNQIHKLDFSKCGLCRKCVDICPTGALSVFGSEMTADEVINIVLKDKDYYETSGGGVTFSGGEPTQQPDFLLELLTLSKEHNLHTCIETNGYIPSETLKMIVPLTDLFLLDYKITDSQTIKQYIGANHTLWRNTLNYLQTMNKAIILRMPIIPGINDNTAHFTEAKALKKQFAVISKIEIMPYHSIGASKWSQIGLQYSLESLASATPEQKSFWESQIAD